MNKMLSKMKKEKEMEKLSPGEQQAKMSVLNHLRDMADEKLGGKLKGLKKVSVMADSPEGLKEGLSKAEKMMDHHKEEPMASEESAEHEVMESPEEEMMEHSSGMEAKEPHEMSEQELDAKLKELMALKMQFRK